MKKLVLLVAFLCVSTMAFAGVNVKAGYIGYKMDNADYAPYAQVSYEGKNFEAGVGYYELELKGEKSFYWCWRKMFGLPIDTGTLKAVPIYALYKLHFGKLALGLGGGYQLLAFDQDYRTRNAYKWNKESYKGKAAVDNEWFGRMTLGYDIKPNVAFEVIGQYCDLNIESGRHDIGIAEDESNLNLLIGALVFKF